MEHAAKVAAVHDRSDLSLDEKHRMAARLKSRAHANHPLLPRRWRAEGVEIRVRSVEHDDKHNLLRVDLSATRAGKPIDLDLPFQYVNPPLGVRAADGSVVEDVPQAFREMVTRTVLSQAG